MRAPLLLLSLLTVLLAGCGRNAEALNAQGYRAMRFGAHIDAGYFFEYAGDLIAEEGVPEGAEEHPEQQRLVVGRLALDLFTADVALPTLPARSDGSARALTPDQMQRALHLYRIPRGMNAIRAAIAERPEAFGPEDLAFLVSQLLDEARRPGEAAELLDYARQRFGQDAALAELAERLGGVDRAGLAPAGFLERRSTDPPLEELIALADQLPAE